RRAATSSRSAMRRGSPKIDSTAVETARTCPWRSKMGPRLGLRGIVREYCRSAKRASSSRRRSWRGPRRTITARWTAARTPVRISAGMRNVARPLIEVPARAAAGGARPAPPILCPPTPVDSPTKSVSVGCRDGRWWRYPASGSGPPTRGGRQLTSGHRANARAAGPGRLVSRPGGLDLPGQPDLVARGLGEAEPPGGRVHPREGAQREQLQAQLLVLLFDLRAEGAEVLQLVGDPHALDLEPDVAQHAS